MRFQKSHLVAVSGVMMLVVSFVLSAPRTTKATSSISQAAVADTSDDLSIDASLGDTQVVLKRKHRRPRGTLIVIQIIAVLIATRPSDNGRPPMIDLNATITGADAVQGSLLYALAWLAGYPDPLRSVRALGYDIDVSEEHDRPCTDGPPSGLCQERARRLATLLDATLALGNPDDRILFRQGASALGVAPDCSAAATTGDSPVLRAASPDRPADLLIDASVGDRQMVLKRRVGGSRIIIFLVPPQEVVALGARVTGADMVPGSLLYALAWLAGQPDPLGSVRALGYDIAVANPHVHSCSNQLSSHTCEDAARNLATLLDATLGLGDPAERARFRQDASLIGVAPDCVVPEP